MQGIDKFPDFITALPELDLPFAGARGWLLQGKEQQVVFLEFNEDVEVPEHTHDEQLELALTGKVVLSRDGAATEFKAGDNFFIPAGTPHAGAVKAGYKALIVFNAPDRYKPK